MRKGLIILSCVLVVSSLCLAVKPVKIVQQTEADFATGKLDKTAVTNLGEIRLSREIKELTKSPPNVEMFSAVAINKAGEIYLSATGGKIYRFEGDKLVEFAQVPGVLVRTMIFDGRDLYVGSCGKSAGIYRITPRGKVIKIWSDPKVKFVWSIVRGKGKSFYAATGPEGKVYHVKANGKAEVVYQCDEKNILSMIAGKDGKLYAGTGEHGYIIEINPKTKKGRILYDAKESEISALLLGADGVLYAATSDSTKVSAGKRVRASEVKGKALPKPATKPPVGPKEQNKKVKKLIEVVEHDAKVVSQLAGNEGGVAGSQKKPRKMEDGLPIDIIRRIAAARKAVEAKPPQPTESPKGAGNAIYRIDEEGFVRTIFRKPVAIFTMVMQDDTLIVGTGHKGEIFEVDTSGDKICQIAKVDPKDITAITLGKNGKLYFATADSARLFELGRDFAKKGTYTSKVFDAKQISRWGSINIHADIPRDCALTVSTRSGNVSEPDDGSWSDWSVETIVPSGWLKITSPAGRFFQYRLTLAGNGKATATVDRVEIIRQMGNLPPAVPSVKVNSSARAPNSSSPPRSTDPKRYRVIKVKCTDPNEDSLWYAFYYRRKGNKLWIKLADKKKRSEYYWDTLGVADGIYEVRVVVSDAPSNPPAEALTAERISRDIVVDNTPPMIVTFTVKQQGKGKVALSGKVADALSRISDIAYSIDTDEHWVTVLPDDGICDSSKEAFSTIIKDIEPGLHRVAIRVRDEFNNTAYSSVEVMVGK